MNIRPSFKPYEGEDSFIFISYAHLDRESVFPIIDALNAGGFKVWYDEGVDPGTEWPEEIASHLVACTVFLLFTTPESMESSNVRREINMAIKYQKKLLNIMLRKTDFSAGMDMQLSLIQYLTYSDDPESGFHDRLQQVLSKLLNQHAEEPAPPPPVPRCRWRWAILPGAVVAAIALLLMLGLPQQWLAAPGSGASRKANAPAASPGKIESGLTLPSGESDSSAQIAEAPVSSPQATQVPDLRVKATGQVNVRNQPGLAGASLGTFASGGIVDYLGETRTDERRVEWYKISFKEDEGWVSSKYCDLIE
jgi:hypothetical protein